MTPNYSFLVFIAIFGMYGSAMAQYDPNYQKEEIQKYDGKISNKERTWWFDGGFGFVGEDIGYQASFNYQVNDRLMISTGYDRADYFSDKPEEWSISNSISIDGGFVMKGRSLIGYFTVGPSYTWGNRTNSDNSSQVVGYNKTNLKFKAGCIVRKYHLGISPFVHFNVENTIAGITLNFVMGKNVKR